MGDETGLVSYEEPVSIRVGKFIISKEFSLATIDGFARGRLYETDSLGILYEDPKIRPINRWFGLVKEKPPRIFLGTIVFNDGTSGANNQRWVFQVRGREYVELAKRLAEEMAQSFNTKIVIRLVCDKSETESLFHPFRF